MCQIVGGCRSGDGDVHANGAFYLLVVDLGEDQDVPNPKGVVAPSIKGAGAYAAEVANSWQPDANQAVQKLEHPLTAQGHLGPDRHALTQFECCDGLARPSDHRLLAGDVGQLLRCHVQQFRVPRGLTDADVASDLLDPWNLHRVVQLEILLKLRNNLFRVLLL